MKFVYMRCILSSSFYPTYLSFGSVNACVYCKIEFYLFVFEMCSALLLAKACRCCSY